MIQNAERTCALVAGLGTYRLGQVWELPGARIAADRFTAWLVKTGVDRSRIYERPNATADDIRQALYDLKEQQTECDCLVIYWAGHGFETENNERGLFVSDASEIAAKAINIDEILSYLRIEASRFTTQLGIIDTCATGRLSASKVWEHLQMKTQLPRAPGDIRFLLAAPSGLESDYPDEGQPSLFSRRLLDLLHQDGMTVEALFDELKRDYAVFERTGGAKYWSGGQARSEAWGIEAEVCRIGAKMKLDPARWRSEARRLDATLDMATGDFSAIVEKISGWERKLAGKICAALLLRGAAVTGVAHVKELVRTSPYLASSYEEAAKMVEDLRAFQNPSYLVRTAYRQAGNELGATGVWFLSGAEKCEPQRLMEWPEPSEFEEAICTVTDHMEANEIRAESAIQIVTPLRFLLEPQADILKHEADYPIVFRERNRTDGLESFKTLRPKLRDRLVYVKSRALRSFKLGWFGPNEENEWASVEFPVLRTGRGAEAEANVEKLLRTLAPFAAVTRSSIDETADETASEAELARAIAGEQQFANIPIAIHKKRNEAGSILPHLTIIWDDPELPKGYFH